jgi:hypothetical protein
VFNISLVNYSLELIKKIVIEIKSRNEQAEEVNVTPEIRIEQLIALRKIYNKIQENSEIINKSFGLSILFLVCGSVIVLVVTGYELLLMITSKFDLIYLVGNLHALIHCLSLLTILIIHCNRTSSNVSKNI